MAKLIDYDNLSRFWEKAKDYIDGRIDSRVGGAVYDNVMIAYHHSSDNVTRLSKLDDWPDLQSAGQYADGVAIVEGGHNIVVAPDSAALVWASENGNYGGIKVSAKLEEVIDDWDGRGETAAHLEYEACQGEDYANGWCAAYSRLNAQGYGYAAGEWYLPAIAELLLMYTHKAALMRGLSLIDGAFVNENYNNHWTSTEASMSWKWRIGFTSGQMGVANPTSSSQLVRPVTQLKY